MTDRRINIARLMGRLRELAAIGEIDGGGCCRLALTDDDKRGRDLVVSWMDELGMTVSVDRIGNVIGVRPGRNPGPPVTTGSHIDTVRTGGKYDGNLGVLVGLEIAECLNEAGVTTEHDFAVGFFTNEEGARFAPDMMGSGVQQGLLDLDECLATVGIDGKSVGAELQRIGYAGSSPCEFRASAFIELHIEQGPVLDAGGITIGAVTSVQGISWTEITIEGVSNHAGTTPMVMRTDAGHVAAEIAVFARNLAKELGAPQVATVGQMTFKPNLVNVVPNHVVMTLDLRNTDDKVLQQAEARAFAFIGEIAAAEGATVSRRTLARFEPVTFDPGMIKRVEDVASQLGHSVVRLPSGAGHDAQMFAPNCPSAMIFVPSDRGISHNVEEHTDESDLEAGANVLFGVLSDLLG